MTNTARSNGDPVAHFNENEGKVKIDKLTQAMKMMYNIKAGRVGYYRKIDENMSLLIEHWDNVVIRDEVDDAHPELTYKSITRKGDDHFAISSIYAMIGMEKIMAMASGNQSSGLITSLNTTDVNSAGSDFSVDKMFSQVKKTQLQTDDY